MHAVTDNHKIALKPLSILNKISIIHAIILYKDCINLDVLSAVLPSLSIVKTCTVNGSSDGKDETRVNKTDPSDSPAEVVLLKNRTANKTSQLICEYNHRK